MKYLYHYKGSNGPKNKLETEVYSLLKQDDRKIIAEGIMSQYQRDILESLDSLNLKYNRCSPIKVTFKTGYTGDILVFVGSGDTSPFHATLLKIKE